MEYAVWVSRGETLQGHVEGQWMDLWVVADDTDARNAAHMVTVLPALYRMKPSA